MKHVLFLLLLFSIVLSAGCAKKSSADKEKAPVRVRTAVLSQKMFQNIIATQGVVEAVDQAVLSAVVPGKIECLPVREGDKIKKGQLLFRIDRKNLENACRLAEEAVKIAEERVQTRKADLALAKLGHDKSETDYNRNADLYKLSAVSSDVFETYQLAFQKSKLTIDQAQAALSTAQAEVSFTKAAMNIARKKLEDSECFAPYDGIVSAKFKHENEFCGAGTPVLKVERPDVKRITALISGIHYGQIKPGKTLVEVAFNGKTQAKVPVTSLPGTIDPVSRTFEFKADLPTNFVLPSGTLCELRIILSERKNSALPEESVLFRQNSGFLVYAVEGNNAIGIPVAAGITQNGYTEILNPEKLSGKEIIVSGQYFVSDGAAIQKIE